MKKRAMILALTITLCALMISGIGMVSAVNSAFIHTSYMLVTACTVDGKWTSTSEWSDCQQTMVGTSALFRDKWGMTSSDSGFTIDQYWLFENLADATTDSGDYLELCLDSNMDGGAAPATDDYRVVLTPTTMTWYKGTGSAWGAMATPAGAKYSTSVNTSFSSGGAHRIYELYYEKMALGVGAEPAARIAFYDASNTAAGINAWPTAASANVPNAWGDVPYSMDAVPEGFNVGILLALTSVAVIAGAVLVRKRITLPKFITQ
jgi:hypothetical protein